MNLGHIERGTKLKIFEAFEGRAVSDEYEATFKFLETGKLFLIQSQGLYTNYEKLKHDATLTVCFQTDHDRHMFSAHIVEKQRSKGILLLEQLADIVTINRRNYERDELRVKVNIYGLPSNFLGESSYSRPTALADMTDYIYDISSGGICIISNTLLTSKYDPYYLVEFSLSSNDRDMFLLPARLVRRSNYPRTKIGRYDYGFEFIFDNHPEEKGRVTRGILSRKLSYI